MMKKSNKLKILATLLFSMFLLTALFQSVIINYQNSDQDDSKDLKDELKIADSRPDVVYFCNGSINSWNDAKLEGWVTGDGTGGNPYTIANLEIDCEDSKTGIRIENWGYNQFSLKIENCTFTNIRSSDDNFPKS